MTLSRRALLTGIGAVAVSGCASLPSADTVSLAARGIGGSVGLLLNEYKFPEAVRTLLSTLVTTAARLTPAADETLVAVWTATAKNHVAALVAAGTLTPLYGALALAAFVIVLAGLSLLERRYPALKTVRTLLSSAVTGFCDGFLATFRPTGLAIQDYDAAAYDELKALPELAPLEQLVAALP